MNIGIRDEKIAEYFIFIYLVLGIFCKPFTRRTTAGFVAVLGFWLKSSDEGSVPPIDDCRFRLSERNGHHLFYAGILLTIGRIHSSDDC